MKRQLITLLSLAAALPALPALADDNSTLASPLARERSSSQVEADLGVGVGFGSSYLGSSKNKWAAGVVGEANFSNGMFLSTVDGVGYRFFEDKSSGFSASASIGPSGWRKEKAGDDSNPDRLRGMGDINVRAQANLFLNYDQGPFHASAALHQVMGDRRGTSVDLVGKYDVLATKTDLVQTSAGLTYANKSMMQTFFGVTPTQSANSGNAVYTPSAGGGGGVGVMWRHAINEHWVSTVGAGVERLGSAAADSPLTDKRNSAGVGASIAYRF